jgi:large repetitive protein
MTRVLAVALLAAGCLDGSAAYHCDADHVCDKDLRCISGLCAGPDGNCPSGFRWDSSAGPQSGQCSETPDIGVDPNCGNGTLEPGEYCDPGMGSPQPCPSAADCDDGEPCTNDVLLPPNDVCHQICAHTYEKLDDGVACPLRDGGVPGTCYKHTCCTGCWNGNDCRGGETLAACGTHGKACADCPVDGGGGCVTPTCTAGACAPRPAPEGSQCAGGTCHHGACCNGCVADGGVCLPGTVDQACGAMGNGCATCMAGPCGAVDGGVGGRCANCAPKCANLQCGDDSCGGTCPPGCTANQLCMNGQCVCADNAENDDVRCKDGRDNDCNGSADCKDAACNLKRCKDAKNFCHNGNCETGCRVTDSGGVALFVKDGDPNPLNPCQVCKADNTDSFFTALPDKTACIDNKARNGLCYKANCCTGCWDGNNCHALANQNNTQCGTGGADCVGCGDNNTCTSDICSNGACTHATLPDGAKCAMQATTCVGACPSGPSCVAGVCQPNKLVTYGSCCAVLCCISNGAPACLLQCL